jgi:nitrogen fixation protein FixH
MRKAAFAAIRAKLMADQDAIKYKLRDNIRQMQKLVDAQTLLKRERAVYQDLIRMLSPPP